MRAYAAQHGLQVEILEPELDVSGAKKSRPILDKVLAGVESGQYAGVMVAQLDRLSRLHITDALAVIERVESAGGRVIAVAEAFDVGTPEGRMARNMFLSVAAMMRERMANGFVQAKKQAVERGIWGAPKVPLGYQCQRAKDGGDGKLHPKEPEATLVREAFQMKAKGVGMSDISRHLGRGTSACTSLLSNRVYRGEIHVQGFPPNLEAHEPLVTEDEWRAAQWVKTRRLRGEPALLGSALMRCTGCRRGMSRSNGYYRCKRDHGVAGTCEAPAWAKVQDADEIVERAVLVHLGKRLRIEAREGTDSLRRATDAADRAEVELQEFQRAVDLADVGAEYVAEGLKKRVEAVEAARRELASIRAADKPEVAHDIRGVWPTLTVEEKQAVIRGAIDVVWVKKGTEPLTSRMKLSHLDGLEVPEIGQGYVTFMVRPVHWDDLDVSLRVLGGEDGL